MQRIRIFFAFSAIVVAASAALAEPPKPKPNYIVILIDDLGHSDLGVYGSKDIPTPNIDSLAKEGVRYTNGYATCFYCSPSRAGLLTGRYQQRFGLEYVGGRLDTHERTIADLLKEQGYATAALGKWHIGEEPEYRPRRRGFDYFYGYLGAYHYFNLPVSRDRIEQPTDPWILHAGYGGPGEGGKRLAQHGAAPILRNEENANPSGYLTELLTQEAVGFIEKNKDRPFFLYLAHAAQHVPVEATEKYLKRFPNLSDEKQRRTYAAALSAVDDGVGEILAKLKELGIDRQTAIVFTSDNGGPSFWRPRPEIVDTIRAGGAFGGTALFELDDNAVSPDIAKLSERYQWNIGANGSDNEPLAFGKGVLYEGGIRVPYIVRWPGVAAEGKVSDDTVSSLDLLPTFLAAAGAKLPTDREYDGVDLRPSLEGKPNDLAQRTLFWRIANDRAVRSGNWKLVWNGDAVPRLYDLSSDIDETKDLATAHPEIVEKLKTAWTEWNTKNAAPPARPKSLRTLGNKTATAQQPGSTK
ncbi:MAG: sulfatase [Thermoguttaceae bacterium]